MSKDEIDEEAIYLLMLLQPDHAYVTPDGNRIYLLGPDGKLYYRHGEGLNTMTPEEINTFIQNTFR